MDPSLRSAASGMIAQQKRIEVISNNLANVNTTAFKRSRAHFEDLLYQTVQGPSSLGETGTETVGGVQIGRGTRLSSVRRMDAQGAIQLTERPLDIAIEGEGYFQIELPNGTMAYTRDGSFNRTEAGQIVTAGGYALVPGAVLPNEPGQVSVSTTGVITFKGESGEPIEVGRIELARFANPTGLDALGENLYAETGSSGPPLVGYAQETGFGRLLGGSLESSNVEIVQEMVEMIAAQRAYEIGSRAIQTGEEMARTTNQLGR